MDMDQFQPQDIQWCDTCRPHVVGECDGCHSKFEGTDSRYRSQSHHFHPGSVAGVAGSIAIHKTLCVNCYREDHAKVYPNGEVPPLPDRGMDPAFFAKQQIVHRRNNAIELMTKAKEQKLTEEEAQSLWELMQPGLK